MEELSAKRAGSGGNGTSGRRFERRGRQVSDEARAKIRAHLQDRPRKRDLLLEYLHLLADPHGYLESDLLAALADELNLSLAELYEVASFYPNFTIAEPDTPKPPRLLICDGLPCQMAGGDALIEDLEQGRREIVIQRTACLGRCDHAPAARFGPHVIERANKTKLVSSLSSPPLYPSQPASPLSELSYSFFTALRSGELTAAAILREMDDAHLRGLGGAGFPTARKWQAVRAEAAPRYLVINADESEPGTFKDRLCLRDHPAQVLEGMLIAAHVIEAAAIYIFLRQEYADLCAGLEHHLEGVRKRFCDLPPIEIRFGAGAYICGEESALLESLEGKRPYPRHKPPYPAQQGLFGRPTLINNVESLYWLRPILEMGGKAFAALGRPGHFGQRLYSLSGRIRQPGVKIAPAGISLRELVETHGGGMAPGHTLAAFLPGGAAGGILPATLADLPLDFGHLEAHGAMLGSAAIIVLSHQDDLRRVGRNLMGFFHHESCGQCTPCRVGTEKALALLNAERWDEGRLQDLAQVMKDGSICGLGQTAPQGLSSLLRFFRSEVDLS